MTIYKDTYCSRNCGNLATHISKKGLYFCYRNAAKCPVISEKSKGKRKSIRKEPEKIESGNKLCEYGCNSLAKYKFSNNKYCCSKSGGNCPYIRTIAVKKSNIKKSQIQSNGKTLAQNTALKISENKKLNIDELGMNMHQRSAKKVSEIKRNKINSKGLNVHEQNGLNYKLWLKSKDGEEFIRKISEKNKKIMNEINDDGEKEAVRRASLMVKSKLSNIDSKGLNTFERSHLKSKNSGFVRGVFYQSLNEKRFLENFCFYEDLRRGPCIYYKAKDKYRRYLSDYITGNRLFEIKSSYTMYGKDNCLLETNIRKLNAAASAGYDVYVVIDDEVIKYSNFVISLSKDQYLSIDPSIYSDSLSLARSLISLKE